ncbi:hypothetical protein JKP88DRAFT_252006 [Tribonema minus]|uniref:Uncharacterized protein n=1 Tax=Tribonema minus TaxID=303371 RepID=A0A836CMH0_9STRA|nr:hypothetical protein JKP88DRAFT_252006 [Tribonema minus]
MHQRYDTQRALQAYLLQVQKAQRKELQQRQHELERTKIRRQETQRRLQRRKAENSGNVNVPAGEACTTAVTTDAAACGASSGDGLESSHRRRSAHRNKGVGALRHRVELVVSPATLQRDMEFVHMLVGKLQAEEELEQQEQDKHNRNVEQQRQLFDEQRQRNAARVAWAAEPSFEDMGSGDNSRTADYTSDQQQYTACVTNADTSQHQHHHPVNKHSMPNTLGRIGSSAWVAPDDEAAALHDDYGPREACNRKSRHKSNPKKVVCRSRTEQLSQPRPRIDRRTLYFKCGHSDMHGIMLCTDATLMAAIPSSYIPKSQCLKSRGKIEEKWPAQCATANVEQNAGEKRAVAIECGKARVVNNSDSDSTDNDDDEVWWHRPYA